MFDDIACLKGLPRELHELVIYDVKIFQADATPLYQKIANVSDNILASLHDWCPVGLWHSKKH